MTGGDLVPVCQAKAKNKTNPNSSVTCYQHCTCPERVAYLQEWGPLLHLLLVQCLGLRAMFRGLAESSFPAVFVEKHEASNCTKVDLLSLLVRPACGDGGLFSTDFCVC